MYQLSSRVIGLRNFARSTHHPWSWCHATIQCHYQDFPWNLPLYIQDHTGQFVPNLSQPEVVLATPVWTQTLYARLWESLLPEIHSHVFLTSWHKSADGNLHHQSPQGGLRNQQFQNFSRQNQECRCDKQTSAPNQTLKNHHTHGCPGHWDPEQWNKHGNVQPALEGYGEGWQKCQREIWK